MKALVYTANEEMSYRDEPSPGAGSGEALVAIESVGICGSDCTPMRGMIHAVCRR